MVLTTQWHDFDGILRQEEGWSLERVRWRVKFMLEGFDVRQKRILDIGCGRGAFTLYLALAGAGHVVGIDPEGSGSSKGVKHVMPRRIAKLRLMNCEFMPVAFGEYTFPERGFDLIISYNSVNHWHEVTSDLRRDAHAYNAYTKYFQELFRITAPGGWVIIADCSRLNLFSELVRHGVAHPIPGMKTIEWDKHQFPSVWKALFRDAGFYVVSQGWYVPAPFKNWRWLIGNQLANFCTFSHFTLRAQRPLA